MDPVVATGSRAFVMKSDKIKLSRGSLSAKTSVNIETIRYYEGAANFYHAAIARRNVAIALAKKERWQDALAYAQAALGLKSH